MRLGRATEHMRYERTAGGRGSEGDWEFGMRRVGEYLN